MGRGIFFFFFLFLFFTDVFFVALGLLFASLGLRVLIVFEFSTWLGALFFLIYVGAVLVIIYYVYSLASKISGNITSRVGNFVGGVFFLIFFFLCGKVKYRRGLIDLGVETPMTYYLFKDRIFSYYDGFVVFFSIILLLALWVRRKFQVLKSLALRIFF